MAAKQKVPVENRQTSRMRQKEMLVFSTKEQDWLKVLHEVKRGHLTQRGAARQIGISDRWVRKLLVQIKQEGDRGIVHRLRGRESKRRKAARKPCCLP